MPGFHDAHVHAVTGGLQEMQCSLFNETSLESALQTVKKYSMENPHLPHISGAGWKLNWKDMPTGIPHASMVEIKIKKRSE